MAEYPDLSLWTDAYLGDTSGLTLDEHGAYMLMLIVAWRTSDCALPAALDDIKREMAAKAKFHGHTFNAVVPKLLAKFWTQGTDGKWRQKRLLTEREARRELSTKAAQSARKRWSNRAQTALKESRYDPDSVPKDHTEPNQSALFGDANALPTQCLGNAPHLTYQKKEEESSLMGFREERTGNLDPPPKPNGHQPNDVTDPDPARRLQKFQIWLAPKVAGGWLTIAKAFDPASQDHRVALNACKTATRNNGKGWPHSAPK